MDAELVPVVRLQQIITPFSLIDTSNLDLDCKPSTGASSSCAELNFVSEKSFQMDIHKIGTLTSV